MVLINKYLTIHPLYLTRLFPLALLLCVTACGGKKDLASKPVTVTSNERVIASSVPNEPPIIILSPSSSNTSAYIPPTPSSSRKISKKTPSTSSHYTAPMASQGNYAVQIGVFSTQATANNAARQARQNASSLLSSAKTNIDTIEKNGKSLYRVKLTGLSVNTATQACSQLKQKQIGCIITR